MSYEFEYGLPVKSYRLGVGIVIVNKIGEIWMARRKRAMDAVLQMPQGGIDQKSYGSVHYWETPFEAAKRELYEETGLYENITWLGVSCWLTYSFPEHASRKSYQGQFIGQRQRWFLLNYHGSDKDIKIGEEFVSWKWVQRNHVIDSTVSFKQGLYRKVLTLLMGNRRQLLPPERRYF